MSYVLYIFICLCLVPLFASGNKLGHENIMSFLCCCCKKTQEALGNLTRVLKSLADDVRCLKCVMASSRVKGVLAALLTSAAFTCNPLKLCSGNAFCTCWKYFGLGDYNTTAQY